MGFKQYVEGLHDVMSDVLEDAKAIEADETMPERVRRVATMMVGSADLMRNAIEFYPVERALGPILKMLVGDDGAQNYVTLDIDTDSERRLSVTAQYADGKTPAEEIRRLERELLLKSKELALVYENLTAVQGRSTSLLEDNRKLRSDYDSLFATYRKLTKDCE